MTEDAPLDPRNVYAATKVHGEHLLAAWARETGGAATALRFHNVYGPGMPRDTPYAGVAALFRSELAAGGRRRCSRTGSSAGTSSTWTTSPGRWSPRATAADGRERDVPLNVGSGMVTTVGELAQALASSSRARTGRDRASSGLGDVRHVTASSDRAAQVLGWRRRSGSREGLATC